MDFQRKGNAIDLQSCHFDLVVSPRIQMELGDCHLQSYNYQFKSQTKKLIPICPYFNKTSMSDKIKAKHRQRWFKYQM